MQIQVDNRIVEVIEVSHAEHQSNKVVYHEVDSRGRHIKEHNFPSDMLSVSPGDGLGFWINGHHYRTGILVGSPCDVPGCEKCPK